MHIQNRFIFILPFLFIAIPKEKAYAQETKVSYTLNEAVEYAMKNQARMQNANLDIEIAHNKVREISGAGLPQISANFDVKDYIELPTQLIPGSAFGRPADEVLKVKFGFQYNATGAIEASQLIFDGSYLVALQSRSVYMDLSQKAALRTKVDVVVAVSKAYYGVLINQERLNFLSGNIERIKKLLDDTKALNENGMVEKLDVDRVNVTYNNLLSEKEKLSRFVVLSSNLLKFQIGMPIKNSITLEDKLSDFSITEANLLSTEFDYNNRVEYGLAVSQKKYSELELRKNRYAYMPTIAAYGVINQNAQRAKFDIFDFSQPWYPMTLIGAKITLPIFDGLQKNWKIKQSRLATLKAENDLKTMAQSIDLDLGNSSASLQNAVASLNSQKKNTELAEEVFRLTKIKYDEGVGSNIEITNAESALREAQNNYYSALYDAILATIDLKKAQGNIK